jgi:hypothetical protein
LPLLAYLEEMLHEASFTSTCHYILSEDRMALLCLQTAFNDTASTIRVICKGSSVTASHLHRGDVCTEDVPRWRGGTRNVSLQRRGSRFVLQRCSCGNFTSTISSVQLPVKESVPRMHFSVSCLCNSSLGYTQEEQWKIIKEA